MKNKTDIQTKNQQIDKILQEQYDVETKILESALLNAAGKTSWDEFLEESEEGISMKQPGLKRQEAPGRQRKNLKVLSMTGTGLTES